MFKAEWMQFWQNKMMRVMLVGVAIIPLIYASIFLKSMWDPYGEVKNLPVAVVNQDVPVEMDGQKLAIGRDFVENLKKEKSLDFHFVSMEKAEQELARGHYFMVVEIPSDFSKNAASVATNSPKKMHLHYTTTEGYNFIAMKMSDAAVLKMKEKLSANISKVYMDSVFDSVKKIATSMKDARDASEKIADNLQGAKEGTDTLKSGANQLAQGVGQYTDGTNQAADAITQVQDGANQLTEKSNALNNGAAQLATGISQASDGANQLLAGFKQLNDAVAKSASDQGTLLTGLQGVQQLLAAGDTTNAQAYLNMIVLGMQSSTSIQDLQKAVGQLQAGTTELSTKLVQAVDGANQVSSGTTQYTQGVGLLAQGVSTLAERTQELKGKSGELKDGATSLLSGTNTLADGLIKLHDGSVAFTDKLASGASEVETSGTKTNKEIEQLITPVELMHKEETPVENNGTAMAPYMISIGLWVGSLAMTIAFDIWSRAKQPKRAVEWWGAKYSVLYLLGVIQSVVLYTGLVGLLGLKVVHPLETLVLMFCASIAFISINGYLSCAFDKVGNFISLILLVVQLGAAGGTYPLVLGPKIFSILHPFLPISHSVFGLRESISVGISPIRQMFFLLLFAGVFALLNYGRIARVHYGLVKKN